MLKVIAAGVAVATALAGTALADGPMYVTTDFPTGVAPSDPFKDNLATIGVGVELAAPTMVELFAPTELTFRLLESRTSRTGPSISTLTVDGESFTFGAQAFTTPGTLLGTKTLSGSFTDLIGFLDSDMPPNAPPIGWPDAFQVYILNADEPNLTGIGPYIGHFDTLYFSIAGLALFEVTSGAIPEPQTWALMIGGFALAGGALRRSRQRQAAA